MTVAVPQGPCGGGAASGCMFVGASIIIVVGASIGSKASGRERASGFPPPAPPLPLNPPALPPVPPLPVPREPPPPSLTASPCAQASGATEKASQKARRRIFGKNTRSDESAPARLKSHL